MRWLALPALILGAAVMTHGCGTSTALQNDDDLLGSPSAPGGQTASTCSACFESDCGWSHAECAGDPECARWLQCARASCSDAKDIAADADCWAGCQPPDSSLGTSLKASLQSCLARVGSTCCDRDSPVGAGGEADPTFGDAAAPQETDGNGGSDDLDADVGAFGNDLCVDCTCTDCTHKIKGDLGFNASPTCAEAVGKCYATEGCWAFMEALSQCMGSQEAGARPGPCLYEASMHSQLPEAQLMFVNDVLPCIGEHCTAVCHMQGPLACGQCQSQSCTQELAEFRGDVEAQRLLWCRETCVTDPSPAACQNACLTQHMQGAYVVQALMACTLASCESACQ